MNNEVISNNFMSEIKYALESDLEGSPEGFINYLGNEEEDVF